MKTALISTYADDILITERQRVIRQGGPALFISSTLNRLGISYDTITASEHSKVEIDMRKGREIGRICYTGKITPPKNKEYDLTLISTLTDEFTLEAIGSMPCLDIQGYVRQKDSFGGKKNFDSKELLKFRIIKGTAQEMKYIRADRLNEQQIIIATRGKEGFDIMNNGKTYSFKSSKLNPINTIGAGDTFFAAYCVKYFQTRKIIDSAEFAREITEDFLKLKGEKND